MKLPLLIKEVKEDSVKTPITKESSTERKETSSEMKPSSLLLLSEKTSTVTPMVLLSIELESDAEL